MGLVVICVCVYFVKRCMFPASPQRYNGSGGIARTDLFQTVSKAPYTPSMLLPIGITPAAPGQPVVIAHSQQDEIPMKDLVEAVQTIENNGYAVGYVMLDLDTGRSMSYNADSLFYSASSIKGPYVTSIVQDSLKSSVRREETRISNILEYSDNDTYFTFRSTYGNEPFKKFVVQSGADQLPGVAANDEISDADEQLSSHDITDNMFEFYTPNQLAALWSESYKFLSSDKPGAHWLAHEFEEPETSVIHPASAAVGTSWSKAGWYPAGDPGYATTVDAGVVRTPDSGSFIVVAMTTAPEDFDALATVVNPLITMHTGLK